MADRDNSASRLAKAPAVIVASGDQEIQEELIPVLKRCGLQPVLVSSLGEIRRTLEREEIALVFCAQKLPDGSFRDALRMFQGACSKSPVVIASPQGDCDEYLEAMQLGAFDYVATPYRFPEVERVVKSALGEHGMDDGHPDGVRHQADPALGRRS